MSSTIRAGRLLVAVGGKTVGCRRSLARPRVIECDERNGSRWVKGGVTVRSASQQDKKSADPRNAGHCPTVVLSDITEPLWRMEWASSEMRIHQWQLRGPDRAVKEILQETPPAVVGHGIIDDAMPYLTARRAEDGALFRVFLNPEDLRRLVRRAMEQEETAAIVRQIAG